MKTWKLVGALGAAAALLGGHAAQAQTDTVTFVGAGSSAQFNVFGQAAESKGYFHHYTQKSSGNFFVKDAADPQENAQVWICWTDVSGTNTRQIALFAQVDSTVGVRAFYNKDAFISPAAAATYANTLYTGTFGQTSPQGTLLPKGSLPGADTTDSVPPADVVAALSNGGNGVAVNVGVTDINNTDALFATLRSLALGYGKGGANNSIKSAVSTTSTATPVLFSLSSRPSFTETQIGADPIMVFLNQNTTSPGHFGTTATSSPFNNIDRFVLAGFLSGQLDLVSDIVPTSTANGAPEVPVYTYVREPLSGTYNTTEYCDPESAEVNGFTAGAGQEFGNATVTQGVTTATQNPLNEPTNGSLTGLPDGGGRIRAIGTGQLVGAVAGTLASAPYDALGYAFWGVGTFSGQTNLRYITVDGADPIQDSYSGGAVSGVTTTFRNIVNGGYPLWSILRAYTDNTDPNLAAVGVIVTQATVENPSASGNGSADFVQANTLQVQRLFRPRAGVTSTTGGDVGGAVFTKKAALDFGNDFQPLPGLRQ